MSRQNASSLSSPVIVFGKIVGALTLIVNIVRMIAAASTFISLWMGLEYDPSIYHTTSWYRLFGYDSKLFFASRQMAYAFVGLTAGVLLLKQGSSVSWAIMGLFWIHGALLPLTWPNASLQTLAYGGLQACIGLTCCLAAVKVKRNQCT